MTRKDYQRIASAIRRLDLRTDYKQTRERELLRDLVTELADELEADNPQRFNRDRFVEAALRELAPTPQKNSFNKWTGTYCSVCGKPQMSTPAGDVCENGQGGAAPTP